MFRKKFHRLGFPPKLDSQMSDEVDYAIKTIFNMHLTVVQCDADLLYSLR